MRRVEQHRAAGQGCSDSGPTGEMTPVVAQRLLDGQSLAATHTRQGSAQGAESSKYVRGERREKSLLRHSGGGSA